MAGADARGMWVQRIKVEKLGMDLCGGEEEA